MKTLPWIVALVFLGAKAGAVAQPSSSAIPTTGGGAPAAAEKASAEKGGGSDESFTLENSLTIRDPFRRFTAKALAEGDEEVPPLLRWEVDKYKLTGVVTGPKVTKAMIVDPDKEIHVVRVGDKLGLNSGVVKKIAPGQVLVIESLPNLVGTDEKVEHVIEFEDDDEKKKGQ